MRQSMLLSAVLSSCLLAGCSQEEGKTESTASSPGATPGQVAQAGLDSISSACQIFTPADIKGFFSIPAESELKISEGGGVFPSCAYEWGKDLVVRRIKAGGQDIEVKEPAKVMLVVAKSANADRFTTSTAVYKDAEDMPGIGDMARWGASMSQLTFLSGRHLFHVNVKAHSNPAENKKMAVDLSRLLLQKI